LLFPCVSGAFFDGGVDFGRRDHIAVLCSPPKDRIIDCFGGHPKIQEFGDLGADLLDRSANDGGGAFREIFDATDEAALFFAFKGYALTFIGGLLQDGCDGLGKLGARYTLNASL
jgi:hypothetical protein